MRVNGRCTAPKYEVGPVTRYDTTGWSSRHAWPWYLVRGICVSSVAPSGGWPGTVPASHRQPFSQWYLPEVSSPCWDGSSAGSIQDQLSSISLGSAQRHRPTGISSTAASGGLGMVVVPRTRHARRTPRGISCWDQLSGCLGRGARHGPRIASPGDTRGPFPRRRGGPPAPRPAPPRRPPGRRPSAPVFGRLGAENSGTSPRLRGLWV